MMPYTESNSLGRVCIFFFCRHDYPLRVLSAIVECNKAIKMWLWNLYLIWALVFFSLAEVFALSHYIADVSEGNKRIFIFPPAFKRVTFRFFVYVNANYLDLWWRMWWYDRRFNINPSLINLLFISHSFSIRANVKIQ